MALERCRYCMSKNDSKRPIMVRNLKPGNVLLEDKAAKVRPLGTIPSAHHIQMSRWAAIRSPGA